MRSYLFVLVVPLAQVSGWAQTGSATASRVISIDATKGPLSKSFNVCVGAGQANEGLRTDWQQQLTLAKKECGFHGLLHDDMGVYTEDCKGNPVYNWQYIDQLYDFLFNIGVKPFVELSFMPSALKSADKRYSGGRLMGRPLEITRRGRA